MPTEQGLRLLSALRAAGSTSALRDIPETFFVEEDERTAFRFLIDHVTTHRAFPSITTFARHTGLTLVRTTEPLSYYVDRARRGALYTGMLDPFQRMREAVEGMDPDAAVAIAREMVSLSANMASSASDYISLQSAMQQVIRDYDEAKMNMALRGITSGWEDVDNVTDGWQNDDLISIIGRPGVGKTYIMLYMAYHAWLAGYSVLFVSMELGAMQLARRMFGLHSRINPTLIKRGQLSTAVRANIEEQLSGFGQNGVPFNIVQGGFRKSVETVSAVAEATEPDLILADASYLLKSTKKKTESRREAVADTIEDIKRVAIERHRPIIQSLQFGRSAERVKTKDTSEQQGSGSNRRRSPTGHLALHKIGETDVAAQASSIVIGFTPPDITAPKDTRWGKFLKGREGEGGIFQINYSFNPVDLSMIQFGVPEEDGDEAPEQRQQRRRVRSNLRTNMV